MSKNFDFVEEPIPLITVNNDHKLEVNPSALEILNGIEKPLAVVGVAGMYRTGKSYLLNRVILNKNSGFGVGPTINPCTKGIWMWGRPLKGQTADGEIVNVIVLDSEGLAAVDQDNSHDSRIFSLVMLLSSIFIYNSVGSIDEQALENLSLVVNLTKNIHIKNNGNEDLDFEDFSYYMPYFLWVVRDFALELVDTEGEAMNSKQYLEVALQDQKGFSEQTEQKNQIRHLLRAFFKERNCFTMVRPVTDEANLRNLEHADPSQLRPEFVEQVVELRKQILSQSKKKYLNDSELTGQMLAGLLENYVKAINDKDVPNIENAWNYICKAQCTKAFEESFAEYDEGIKEALQHSWPVSQSTLKGVHKECADHALKQFKRKAVGDNPDEYFKQLKADIKEKYEWLKSENARDFERLFLQSMNNFFASEIDPKLKSKQYNNFIDFEKDLKAFEHYFIELEPQGPYKSQLLAEYTLKKMTESIYMFIHTLENDYEAQLTKFKERKSEIEEELQILKEKNAKEKGNYDSRINELENINRELQSKLELVTESLERVKQEKAKIEEHYTTQLNELNSKSKESLDQLKAENSQLSENLKSLERDLALKDSEFDKQTALLQQKVNFYEERLNSLDNKEESHTLEITKIRTELTEKHKEITTQLETEITDKTKELQRVNERLLDLEEELEVIMKRESDNIQAATQRETKLKDELARKNEKLEEMEAKLAEGVGMSSVEAEQLQQEITDLKATLEAERQEFKQAEDKTAQLKNNFEKEKALLKQNNEFLEAKCEGLKRQLDDSKKLYEETLKTLEYTADEEKTDLNQQLSELTAAHRKEIKNLEQQLSSTRSQYNEEISRLNEALDTEERRATEEVEKLKAEVTRYKESFENAERERLSLKKDNQLLDEQREELARLGEERASEKLRSLEEELENLKEKHAKDLVNGQKKQEETFRQMKSFFESEKERLEKKLTMDRDNYENKLNKLVAEYEERIREDQNYHEEEIENLKNEFQEYMINNNSALEHYKQSLINAETAAEDLRNQLEKVSSDYETLKKNYDANIDGLRATLDAERKQLIENLDKARAELVSKDKELWNITQRFETANAELTKAQEQYNLKLKPLEEENSKMKTQFDSIKEKYNKLNDEHVDYKIEVGKKLALSQQQNEFLTKRVEELQKQIDGANRKIEEKLREQREEHMKELSALKTKFEDERKDLEVKYESKRRALKEAENLYNEKLAHIDKAKTDLADKLAALKSESLKTETKLLQENEQLKSRLDGINSKSEGTMSELRKQVEALKDHKYKLEMDLAESKANYEKDQALWEGKFTFQEEQKEQLSKELQHEKKNFDLMLQKLQKMRSTEKEDTANNQNVIISNIEQRYNAQVNELNEKHLMAVQALQERNAKLEREIKNLNEKLLAENNSKLSNYGNIERKLNEAAENEKMLQEQIVKLRQERENKLLEAQRKHEDTVQTYKSKLSDVEEKMQEVEKKKSILLFEHEKDKAKWTIEKEHLISQKNDLLEQVSKLEKKKELLLRENEKLKNENRTSKKLLGTNLTSNFQTGRFTGMLNSSKLNDRSFVAFEGKLPSSKNFQPTKESISKNSFLPDNNSSVESQRDNRL